MSKTGAVTRLQVIVERRIQSVHISSRSLYENEKSVFRLPQQLIVCLLLAFLFTFVRVCVTHFRVMNVHFLKTLWQSIRIASNSKKINYLHAYFILKIIIIQSSISLFSIICQNTKYRHIFPQFKIIFLIFSNY